MKIAAIQMLSTADLGLNFERAAALVGEAAEAGAELVGLPEYFCLMGRHDADKLAHAETPGDGPIQRLLAETARRHGVWLAGGTLPLAIEGDAAHAFNTTLVYAPDGSLAARYDKIHLFRFDDGQRRYDEAATLRPGRRPVAFDLTDRSGARWRVGLSICYDLRFPELYRTLGEGGPLDLLMAPAAFTHTTGQAHWELLLRTRAVENQCFVLAPAQGGLHDNGRRTWGHSMAVGPWGEVLAVGREDGEAVVLADIDPRQIAEVRASLPALQHRVL